MRGVIIGPHVDQGGTRLSTGPALEGVLRRSLLYADAIDLPTSPMHGYMLTASMRELMSFGVFKRTWLNVSSFPSPDANAADILLDLQFKVFDHLEGVEPGVWSVAQGGASLSLPATVALKGRGVLVTFDQLLPVPAEDVPLSEIMQFKTKRAPEMEAFHAATDDLYQHVRNSTDEEHAYRVAKERIQARVSDMFGALKESMATRLLTTARIALRIGEGVSAAALHDPMRAGVAGIHLAAMATETPSIVKRLGPFAFVHEVIRVLT